jgi:hypothetical protein
MSNCVYFIFSAILVILIYCTIRNIFNPANDDNEDDNDGTNYEQFASFEEENKKKKKAIQEELIKEKAYQEEFRVRTQKALYYNPLMHVEQNQLESLGAWQHGLMTDWADIDSLDVCPPGWKFNNNCNNCTYDKYTIDDGKFIYL